LQEPAPGAGEEDGGSRATAFRLNAIEHLEYVNAGDDTGAKLTEMSLYGYSIRAPCPFSEGPGVALGKSRCFDKRLKRYVARRRECLRRG
jgi:hypothetical protein